MKKALFSAIIFIILVIFSVIGFNCKGQISSNHNYFQVKFYGEIYPRIVYEKIPKDSIHLVCQKWNKHLDRRMYPLNSRYVDDPKMTYIIRYRAFPNIKRKCMRCEQRVLFPVSDTIYDRIDMYYIKNSEGSIIIE